MLQLRNIRKTYKNGNNIIVALDNVNLDFPNTGLVFVVGKSGSGKSTLLNILGGLDKMDSGEIIINGRSTSEFSAGDFDAYRNYHIGFIFQEFNLIDDITVKENIALALKIQSKGHDQTTIDEALKLVNLEGLGYRSPKELSGGQKQRISVARALVKNPNIILADEPTGALDSKTGYDLMSSLKSLSSDKLVIVVTHDDEIANVFGDEIIRLNDGHIIDHLIVSPNYGKLKNERVTSKIIKINSGNQIENIDLVNSLLENDKTNFVCLINQPELLTIAYPNEYSKIFEKEDLSSKFVSSFQEPLKEIETAKESNKHQKTSIKFNECLKMAFNQYSNHKSRLAFLLIFTIVAFTLLGFSSLFFTINNGEIVSNALDKNNLNLAIIEHYSGAQKMMFNKDSLTSLNEIDDNLQYSFSKKTDMPYTLGTPTSNSPFEMQYFRGIIECDNLDNLNLQLVAGNQSFNENSLNNHEIIISDYAAFELRRTGYLGLDNQGNYGVIHPNSLEDQINSSVRIYSTNYKIIGVFKTNYEDFLPLIVSETYVDDDNQKASSLDALKNYYYARVFGPSGFYNKYVLDNANDFAPTTFSMSVSRVPLYEFDSAGNRLDETLTYKDLYIGNISSFLSYENYRTKLIGRQTLVWGQIPSSLKNNQIILTTNWIGYNGGFNSREAINEAIPTLQENLYINKMLDSNTVDYTLYGGGFEIVAVISISNNATDSDRLSEVGAFFSDDFEYRLNNSIYDFDQMVTTTYNNTSKNSRLFNKFYKNGYHILNIDGKVPTDTLDIQSFQTFGLIAGVVVFVFAILFMFNYVSTSIKKRRKEIGILRATGARSNDILKMFLVEEGILAIVATLISLLLIVYIRGIVNEQLGNVAIGINIINISFIFVLLYVVATLLFFVITTLIPVMSIAKMKPIDAIRKI